jgi:hypothetical protein
LQQRRFDGTVFSPRTGVGEAAKRLERGETMKLAHVLTIAVVALAVAATSADAGTSGYFNCGVNKRIAGQTWAVRTVNVKCSVGIEVVSEVATTKLPASHAKLVRVPGTHQGMRCLGGPPGSKPRSLTCAKVKGPGVLIAARTK